LRPNKSAMPCATSLPSVPISRVIAMATMTHLGDERLRQNGLRTCRTHCRDSVPLGAQAQDRCVDDHIDAVRANLPRVLNEIVSVLERLLRAWRS
jgi:hypothetical protein